MKRIATALLTLAMLLSLVACGNSQTPTESSNNTQAETPDVPSPALAYDPNDLEGMLAYIETTGENAASTAEEAASVLIGKLGDSYQTYADNKALVTEHYASMLALSNQTYESFKTCSYDYFKCVAAQGLDDYDTWDDAVSEFYDVWDDTMGKFYDSWDDSYGEIYDLCDELISDASDELDYKTYSDAWSSMYEEYSDAWAEMYETYSDAWSQTYSDYSEVWGGFYAGESDVDAILAAAGEDDEPDDAPAEDTPEDTSASNPETVSDYKMITDKIDHEVETTLTTLTVEWEALSTGIDSFADYTASAEKIEAFYSKVNATSALLCANMCAMSVEYAEAILDSGKSTDDMYDDMDALYDLIYDDVGDEIYDGIYDGMLDDMYDALYDGALDDSDGVNYSDWSNARSKEYKMWSDTRSDTYEQWSDFRSDVYGFWSDVRGELWGDSLDDAREEVADFKEDVEKMLDKLSSNTASTSPEPTTTPDTDAGSSGIDPAFKSAMDSYEAFFDEYVEFMTKFKATDDVLPLMDEYGSMMQQYAETMAALQGIDQNALSNEEALYYTEVMLRINQKVLKAA